VVRFNLRRRTVLVLTGQIPKPIRRLSNEARKTVAMHLLNQLVNVHSKTSGMG
jgi:alpha-D-ribose 1-methylphosphonate 5-phosphate C-P lyase